MVKGGENMAERESNQQGQRQPEYVTVRGPHGGLVTMHRSVDPSRLPKYLTPGIEREVLLPQDTDGRRGIGDSSGII